MNIHCILIDDEPDATEVLEQLLRLYCPEVRVVCCCHTVLDGLKAIRKHAPDLLFLDISMPGGNGIELAGEVDPIQTRIVFTTAYPDYSLKAFKVHAFDYLLKPIDPEDLVQTVQRYLQLHKKEQASKPGIPQLIRLSDKDNTVFVAPDAIMYVKAQGSYSCVKLNDGCDFTLTRNIGELEKELPGQLFSRPHKSYLVNIASVDGIKHKDGGFLVLKNGVEIEIARRKKAEIVARLSKL